MRHSRSTASPPPSATALSSWVRAIVRTLEARGHDAQPLLQQAGLDPLLLQQPNARYPSAATAQLWRHAVALTGDPAIGLAVARHVSPTTFHALGFSVIASATLHEAFERVLRYFRIVTDAGELQFEKKADEYQLTLQPAAAPPAPAPEAVDALMLVLVRLCRALQSRTLSPLRVTLCRPAPADVKSFEAAFRAPLQFGAAQNTLCFARAAFEQPLPGANPELVRHNDQIVVRYLAEYDRGNLTSRVRGVLGPMLRDGEPGQERIASALNVSLRSLQRRLAQEGTSYKDILNETRRELALAYMAEARHSVSEIAFLLGFADTSSFSRAFRRWTGRAPTASTS